MLSSIIFPYPKLSPAQSILIMNQRVCDQQGQQLQLLSHAKNKDEYYMMCVTFYFGWDHLDFMLTKQSTDRLHIAFTSSNTTPKNSINNLPCKLINNQLLGGKEYTTCRLYSKTSTSTSSTSKSSYECILI